MPAKKETTVKIIKYIKHIIQLTIYTVWISILFSCGKNPSPQTWTVDPCSCGIYLPDISQEFTWYQYSGFIIKSYSNTLIFKADGTAHCMQSETVSDFVGHYSPSDYNLMITAGSKFEVFTGPSDNIIPDMPQNIVISGDGINFTSKSVPLKLDQLLHRIDNEISWPDTMTTKGCMNSSQSETTPE